MRRYEGSRAECTPGNAVTETETTSAPGRWVQRAGFHATALLLWIALLGTVFALAEIQIEGPAGWAANLPTWRLEHSWLNIVWGDKTITGYHVWVFLFMALVFHLPLLAVGIWSWRLEARSLGGIMVFWIIEDFLWFMLNPAFGPACFNPQYIPWHKHWALGMPVDYIVSLGLGAGLLVWSYRR
jgi:hypothetical protein